MKKWAKKYKWYLIAGLIFLFLVCAFVLPLPYYVEMPGSASDVRTVLSVDNKTDNAKGSYRFVTVSESHASLATLVYAWLTPFTDIYSSKDLTGGISDANYYRLNQFYMETSQNTAMYEALTLAHQKIKMDYLGVYVLQIADNSTFKGKLKIGDTVTGVDGQHFKNSKELIDYVSGKKIGDKVTVSYTDDNQSKTASGKIVKLSNGKNGIGIGLVDHTEVKSDVNIKFNTGNIGGPSAGLMFTLDIYTQLAHKNLRAGRTIAGTGTIESDGHVGDIGGIDKKVVAASRAGATIFFAPNNKLSKAEKKANPKAMTNYQTAKKAAKKIHSKMKIVPVQTVQDAIDYLEKTQ